MIQEALSHGTWVSELDGESYPVIQIVTAQDILDGKPVRMPRGQTALYAQPSRERRREGTQGRLA
jgi:hypothetical protein